MFLPILFVQEEAGQLFRDIAIAISSAVGLSLLVSITVIPSLSARILGRVTASKPNSKSSWSLYRLAGAMADGMAGFVYWVCGRIATRVGVVVAMTFLAIGMAWLLMPKTEYLPSGNREILFGILLPPPGYNLGELQKIAEDVEEDILPLIEDDTESTLAKKLSLPPVENFFYVAWGQQVFMGIVSKIQERARELLPYATSVLRKIPGMFAFVIQPSLFESDIGEGRSIKIEIKGPELEKLIALGGQIFGQVYGLLPGAQIRPIQSLDLGNPELRIIPNRDRLTRVGMTTADLGKTVDALVDGATATDYRLHGEEIDLVVKGETSRLERIQDVANVLIQTPKGERVTLGSLADVRLEDGPTQINHIDSERSITIQVTPPDEIPLETAMTIIEEKVVGPLKASRQLGNLYRINLSGTADDLTRTRQALQWNLVLAIVISYLLMAALFENFFYPFIIMFSVPLAAAGGFIGLQLVNIYASSLNQPPQHLDIVTMLGFVILIGVVVNNAILIVHQSLNNMRDGGMLAREAIRESVRSRIRPIYMSTVTSVFGMMPLVLTPGAGSEFYRGLGSVVVGGLLVSTIFTIFLVPPLLSLVLDGFGVLRRAFSRLKPSQES